MKNVFFSFLLLFSLWSSAQTDSTLKVNADKFEKGMVTPNAQILDVRTAGEFNSGHISHALQADWTNRNEFTSRIAYVDKDKPVYIYCLVGGRSSAAANWMRENGFKQVVELQGGINAWKAADKPLENASTEKQMTIEEYWSSLPKDKTVLVDFGAPWCPPCVKMEPVISGLKKDKSIHFQLINIDAGVQTNLLKSLAVGPIPTFVIYKNGKETWRKEGVVDKQEIIKQLQ